MWARNRHVDNYIRFHHDGIRVLYLPPLHYAVHPIRLQTKIERIQPSADSRLQPFNADGDRDRNLHVLEDTEAHELDIG